MQHRRRLDEVVAGEREQDAFRRATYRVTAAANPLQEGGNALGRGELHHKIDRADIDAELH